MESFNRNVIKHKTGLLDLAAELGNISKACKIMGFSRDTLYRYQAARDAGGVEALFEVSRRKLLWIPIPSGLRQNCARPKRRSPVPIF